MGTVGAPHDVIHGQRQLVLPDGVVLQASCWRPRHGGPWPALLMRQPYGRALASTMVYAHPAWYAAQGYLVVVQDVRGCGDSGGSFRLFASEARDGSCTMAWLRGQPDCNGRIGCYGFSYQGLTQLLWDGPDVPDCTAPAMAGLSVQHHWCRDGRADWWALGLAWALQLAAAACQRRGDGVAYGRIRKALHHQDFCEEGWGLLQQVDPGNHLLRWWSGDWESPVADAGLAAVLRRPMLLIGGWYDPYLRGVMALRDQSLKAGGCPRLVVGPWTHGNWHGGRLDQQHLAFFNHHLKGCPPPQPRHAVQLFDVGRGHWWGGSHWPQPALGRCWLRGAGLSGVDPHASVLLLEPEKAMAGGWDQLVLDPWRPTPARGGHLDLQAGPTDRHDLDCRSDVLTFTSPPLPRALTLSGTVQLRLKAASGGQGFDLCCALSQVREMEGRTRVEQLSMGVERWLGPQAQALAWRRVRFQPLLQTVPAEVRLRLSIALAGWPLIGINPGNGRAPHTVAAHERQVVVVHFRWEEACLQLPLQQQDQATA
ncbi:MAG: CocE/NonD family hydrolase [Cyanobacteria bacterium MAG IRC4_bin_6]|nr:CocE/NonD family hydrolase [Cyanobacteria bacterium MAG IRC3_bin_20]MDE0647605.1 CocE/NonD family hydrolase [Cyanobacteria bacterium MAG IRC4_bin_6]